MIGILSFIYVQKKDGRIMQSKSYIVYLNPFHVDGELSVLFAGSEQTEPEHNTGPNILDYCLVHYVVAGCGYFRGRGRTYTLGAGDSFFILPGELVQYTSDLKHPLHYRWVAFTGSEAVSMLSQCGISAEKPIVHGSLSKRIPILFHRLMDVLKQSRLNGDIMAGGYLRLLLAEYAEGRIIRPEHRPQVRTPIELQIEQAIRWLTLQYYQPISIEQLAHQLGYHRTHLSKMFKVYTGMSPMHFLMKIRMEQAKLLLKESLTIEQVASAVGFNDPLYFSKKFKQWWGSPPSEFRQSLHSI
jgi:AraC-like DNA-binding protein